MEKKPPIDQINLEELLTRAKALLKYLPQYLAHPVNGIKRVPAWDWHTLLILQIGVSAIISSLTGVVTRNLIQVFLGLIFIGPIYGLVFSFIVTIILYYVFLFMMDTQLEFRKMYTVVILAGLPASIFSIFGALFWPFSFVALAVFAYLLIVGISENFLLDQKRVSRIILPLILIVSVVIFFSVIQTLTSARVRIQDYTPESLDQINRELEKAQ